MLLWKTVTAICPCTLCLTYTRIAWKPYKSKAPHALYLRDSACVQIQSLRLVTVSDHRALYITLMCDTVPVAMHGNLLVSAHGKRNKH